MKKPKVGMRVEVTNRNFRTIVGQQGEIKGVSGPTKIGKEKIYRIDLALDNGGNYLINFCSTKIISTT